MTKKRIKEGLGLTALNLFFLGLCFVTLIPRSFTLKNYERVIFGEDIGVWFRNTLVLAASTVSLSLLIAVPAAYCFCLCAYERR